MELPALGIALLTLTAALVIGVSVAQSALGSAERPTLERQTATSVSDRLVSDEVRITHRKNVLNESAVPDFSGRDLYEYGLPAEANATVRLGGSVVVASGTVDDGTTVERIVLVEDRHTETIEPTFEGTNRVTLPRRTATTTVEIRPANTTVRRVEANERVVLQNASGLDGTFKVELSRLETTTLRFDTPGQLTDGDVRIEYYPPEARKTTLQVTVDE